MTDTLAVGGYLFAFFAGENHADGEQVYLGLSEPGDPLRFDDLAGNRPVLRSPLGTGGVRDPFLVRKPDGSGFFLVATDLHIRALPAQTAWATAMRHGSRSIVVWETPDLLTWSEPWLVEVAGRAAGAVWAPEAVWDPSRNAYVVFWASSLFADDDADHAAETYFRMFRATTTDFVTFTEPQVWVDPGHSVIDSTVIAHDGVWYRFTKDERSADPTTPTAKFITSERSPDLGSTSFEFVTDGIGMARDGEPGIERGEGPTITRGPDGRYVLYIDEFLLRGYVPFVADAPDATTWRIPEDYRMPSRARHGCVVPLTAAEHAAVAAHYGVSTPVAVRPGSH